MPREINKTNEQNAQSRNVTNAFLNVNCWNPLRMTFEKQLISLQSDLTFIKNCTQNPSHQPANEMYGAMALQSL